jgi:hypothetical protein
MADSGYHTADSFAPLLLSLSASLETKEYITTDRVTLQSIRLLYLFTLYAL